MSEAIHEERERIRAYPPGMTFLDLIARNRRNSWLLVGGMVLLTVLVGQVIVWAVAGMQPRWETLVIAGIVAAGVVAIAGGWSYFGGANALLRISGAREIEKKDDPQLFNVVEELAIAAGQPMPKVFLIDSEALNAFATGRDPKHAAVAITTGLRKQLTRDELAGVMAHEIAHIRHYDIRLTMLVATLVGLIVLACDVFLRMTIYGGMRGGGRMRGGGGRGGGGGAAMIVMIVVALVLAILAPLLAKMMQLAVSRQREYLADAGAVELTRYPKGLADALRKLSGDRHELANANRATAHMYIINPFHAVKGKTNLRSAFSTHPPTEDRIARLDALMR